MINAALAQITDRNGPNRITVSRPDGVIDRPQWPVIVLRTPKGWTGPKEVDGVPVEGTWRAHQVPLSAARGDAAHLAALRDWMLSRKSQRL